MNICIREEPKSTGQQNLPIDRSRYLTAICARPKLTTDLFDCGMATVKEQWQIRSFKTPKRHRDIYRLMVVPKAFARLVLVFLTMFFTASLYHGLTSPSYATPPKHYRDLEDRVKSSAESGRGNPNNEKVFVAANIVDESLIRGSWGRNLLSLVDLLGEDNVFVSIYENDSGPGTVAALRQLQEQLPSNSSIVTGDHIPLSSFPTIHLPSGQQRVQRISYLAEVRNRLLRPLDPSHMEGEPAGFQSASHIKFDRILFLNDVHYSPLEAVQLLFSTNADSGSAQYRAACAIDFVQFFKLYDTFVVRDADGYNVQLQFFPWFTRRGSGTSRSDVLSLTDAVHVRSCWGGMAAFDAAVFQAYRTPTSVNDSSQLNTTTAIKFRSLNEPYWEAAECCLIFADMEMQYGRASRDSGHGVFVNPYIRTAYSSITWQWLPLFKRLERSLEPFQFLADTLKAPERNPRRMHEPGQMVEEKVWISSASTPAAIAQSTELTTLRSHSKDCLAAKYSGHFEMQRRQAAPGGFCGLRRMFVMKQDVETANRSGSGRNWEKIDVPRDVYLG